MSIPENLPKQDPSYLPQTDSSHLKRTHPPRLPEDKQIADIKDTVLQNTHDSQAQAIKGKGNVIVLTGIVAAGKSSIVKAIQKVDPDFHEEDLDLRRDLKTPTTKEMELAMIDDTIDRSLAGEKTVISLMNVDHFARRMLERGITGIPVKTILAHCPFSEIPGRLEARNQAAESPGGDPGNYRDPLVPMDQFAGLYTQREDGIEEIDRSTASEFFNTSFDKMIAHAKKVGDPLPSDEQIAKDKTESCEGFLKQLGFTNESQMKVSVMPREAFDVIIDTSKYRDAESREAIVAKILKQ